MFALGRELFATYQDTGFPGPSRVICIKLNNSTPFIMKKVLLVIFTMAFLSSPKVKAQDYDFGYTYQGQCLYYKIIDGNARVVCPRINSGIFYWGYDKPTGDLIIPDSVTYNGVTYAVTAIGMYALRDCTGLTSVTIGGCVTHIGYDSFCNCSGITSVIIPNSVTSIGDGAFSGCSGLPSVPLPNSITSIGKAAFGGCTGLTSVIIPSSVSQIGRGAFSGCTSLTYISIGSSVSYVECPIFAYCNNLTSIEVDENNTFYDSRDNSNAIIQTNINQIIQGCKTTTIPNTVTSIGIGAFGYCNGLTSIIIPESVVLIDSAAFMNCTNLSSVFMGNSVRMIKGDAFRHCTNLNSLSLSDSLTFIGNYAFHDCRSLISISIPNNVYYIGASAFLDCNNISFLSLGRAISSIGENAFRNCSNITSVTIPNSMTKINDGTFYNCSCLSSVSIGNSITQIGNGAFSNCTCISSVTLPNSLTYIGNGAFENCITLSSISIPYRVTLLGNSAFKNCGSLSEIIMHTSTPPTLGDGWVFSGVPNTITIYIPCGSLTSYYSDWGHSNSFSSMGFFPDFIESADVLFFVNSSDTTMGSVEITTPPTCQDPIVELLAIANDGFMFDHWGDGGSDNPRTFTLSTYTIMTAYFTSQEDINSIIINPIRIHSGNKRIFVDGADCLEITVFDLMGRKIHNGNTSIITVPKSGVYIVKVDNYPARKIMVF